MFRVGQKVVCVNDTKPPPKPGFLPGLELKKGSIYTIRKIGLITDYDGKPAVKLMEFNPRPPFDSPFWEHRFKPLRETDISIFTAMLNPVTSKETA